MFNKILAACASLVLAAAPATAKVDGGTVDLINYIDGSDIVLSIDGPHCDSGDYLGVYMHRGMKRKLVLCPGGDVDALDHAVVRHEVLHAVQHCVNVARQTPLNTPVEQDTEELMKHANAVLNPKVIKFVQDNYTKDKWLLEIEANLAMELFTAAEIKAMFIQACMG